jgi:hypothetical protein
LIDWRIIDWQIIEWQIFDWAAFAQSSLRGTGWFAGLHAAARHPIFEVL